MDRLQTDRVKSKMIDEAFSRGMAPAITYLFISAALFFYHSDSDGLTSSAKFFAIAMAVLCVIRIVITVLGLKVIWPKSALLLPLNLVVILTGWVWGAIFCTSILTSDLGGMTSLITFAILSGVTSACPTSLIALPTAQMWFYVSTSLAAGSAYFYRWWIDPSANYYFIPGILVYIFFVYFVFLSKKLRNDLMLIFSQQERIEKDMKSASVIQRSLLPDLQSFKDQSKGHSLDLLFMPREALSGDFYDYFIHKNKMLFYVADVTSHGVASAQVTFLIKGIFKNLTDQLSGELNLCKMGQDLANQYIQFRLGYSISLFLGLYNFENGELEYLTSNFPQPAHFENGEYMPSESMKNPIIDAELFTPNQPFVSRKETLKEGDQFFVFTDGIYEVPTKSGKRDIGYKGIVKILAGLPESSWRDELPKRVIAESATDVFEDDVTVLRLHRQKTIDA